MHRGTDNFVSSRNRQYEYVEVAIDNPKPGPSSVSPADAGAAAAATQGGTIAATSCRRLSISIGILSGVGRRFGFGGVPDLFGRTTVASHPVSVADAAAAGVGVDRADGVGVDVSDDVVEERG